MASTKRELTEADISIVSNALRVAAERYKEHAEAASFDGRLRNQFEKQRKEALLWASIFEQADDIQIRIDEWVEPVIS